MQENMEGYPAGLNYSVKDYNNSINRLKMIRDLENAELFFGHDQDQYKAKGGSSGIGRPLAAAPTSRRPPARGAFVLPCHERLACRSSPSNRSPSATARRPSSTTCPSRSRRARSSASSGPTAPARPPRCG